MEILLDTCVFLWSGLNPDQLSCHAKRIMEDPKNRLWLSVLSEWEIILKHQKRKLTLTEPPERFIRQGLQSNGIGVLPLLPEAVVHLSALPHRPRHKDAFDRMLVCQALAHNLTILTPDRSIRSYAARTKW